MAEFPEGESAEGQEKLPIRLYLVRPLREAYLHGKTIDMGVLNVDEAEQVFSGKQVQKPEINRRSLLVDVIHSISLPKIHLPHLHSRRIA